MAEQRFPAQYRVRCQADFRRAYQKRCTASDGRLLVFGYPNSLSHPRLGLSVSRKIGGAVQRNRWKRILREAFRLNRQDIPPGIDLVVIPRVEAEPELRGVAESLGRLAQRLARKLRAER